MEATMKECQHWLWFVEPVKFLSDHLVYSISILSIEVFDYKRAARVIHMVMVMYSITTL